MNEKKAIKRRKGLSNKLFNEVFDKISVGKEITIYIEHNYLEVSLSRTGSYEQEYYDVISHDSSVTAAQAIKKVIDLAMEEQE